MKSVQTLAFNLWPQISLSLIPTPLHKKKLLSPVQRHSVKGECIRYVWNEHIFEILHLLLSPSLTNHSGCKSTAFGYSFHKCQVKATWVDFFITLKVSNVPYLWLESLGGRSLRLSDYQPDSNVIWSFCFSKLWHFMTWKSSGVCHFS